MLIDLTIPVTEFTIQDAHNYERITAFGHIGTHIDVMDQHFPLSYVKRSGIVFNVRGIYNRDIALQDIDISFIKPEMFVAFYSGFIEEQPYGSEAYQTLHPQLAGDLIDALLKIGISLIGVDFAGVRRGAEHRQKDQLCADRGVFIVENLCNLAALVSGQKIANCTMNTYPVSFIGLSGLPCRVVAEV
jgi:kynurenine formamidase